MSLKLAARLVALEPTKIADLQENDTADHLLDLSSIVPPECMAIIIRANRGVGTGNFTVSPMSGSTYSINVGNQTQKNASIVTIKNRELKWRNSVANDIWELILFGYFVQRRTD